MSIINEQNDNPNELCRRLITHYEAKADHNKKETLRCFVLIVVCTLLTPVFITLGSGMWLGKVVPSVLSLLAAGATAWLQQRKPQQLWALYRTAQRELEVEKLSYDYQINHYEKADNPDKVLARKVTAIVENTHRLWVPVVPSPDSLKLVATTNKAAGPHLPTGSP
jgi:hypothetical protein